MRPNTKVKVPASSADVKRPMLSYKAKSGSERSKDEVQKVLEEAQQALLNSTSADWEKGSQRLLSELRARQRER